MRVMVTGASTPLGLAIVEKLIATPDITFVLATGKEPAPTGLGVGSRVLYRRADLTHPREVHDLLWGDARHHLIDVVVHAAQHRRAADHGHAVHAQNVEAARNLLLACREHPSIRRFVYRSFAEVYAHPSSTPSLLTEDDPLDFDPSSPQWLRDRVEADLTVCQHLGQPLQIAVLRCAELLAPNSGSQLWDYLASRVCFRPFGYDPMLNVLSLEDAAEAFAAAASSTATGIFNIRGFDTLPLSRAIAESMRFNVAVPGPLLTPLYRLRHWVARFDFRYDLNMRRFHLGGVVSGQRAHEAFGYRPRVPVRWPRPWWWRMLDDLGELRRASAT